MNSRAKIIKGTTHYGANWMLLCGGRLLQRIIKDEVQKEIITAQRSADLAASLKVDEQPLVHELQKRDHK